MISVCMATYNGENYIVKQIYSILKQLDVDDEVIISDDGSNDTTLELIKKLDDSRIKVFINNGVHGFTHNFENALKNAKGDYIFLSDQDDIWMDNKVNIVKKELLEYDFVTHDCITIDDEENIIYDSRFKEFDIKNSFFHHLLKSRYLGCCMAFNRKVLEASLPFPKADNLIEHDIWIAAVALLYFKHELINECLIYYCRHGNNASNGGFSKGYSLFNKILRRLYRLICLLVINKKVRKLKQYYVYKEV